MIFAGNFHCNVIGKYLRFNLLLTESQVLLMLLWLLAFIIERNAVFQ